MLPVRCHCHRPPVCRCLLPANSWSLPHRWVVVAIITSNSVITVSTVQVITGVTFAANSWSLPVPPNGRSLPAKPCKLSLPAKPKINQHLRFLWVVYRRSISGCHSLLSSVVTSETFTAIICFWNHLSVLKQIWLEYLDGVDKINYLLYLIIQIPGCC